MGYEGYKTVLQPLALKLIFKYYREKLSSPLEEWERNYIIGNEKEIDMNSSSIHQCKTKAFWAEICLIDANNTTDYLDFVTLLSLQRLNYTKIM